MLGRNDAVHRAIVSGKRSFALSGLSRNLLSIPLSPAAFALRNCTGCYINSIILHKTRTGGGDHGPSVRTGDVASTHVPSMPTPTNLLQARHIPYCGQDWTRCSSRKLVSSLPNTKRPSRGVQLLTNRNSLTWPSSIGSTYFFPSVFKHNSTLAKTEAAAGEKQSETLVRRIIVTSTPPASIESYQPAKHDNQLKTLERKASLRDTLGLKRAQRAYEGTKKSRKNRTQYERSIRPSGVGLTWKNLLEELQISTPTPATGPIEVDTPDSKPHRLALIPKLGAHESNITESSTRAMNVLKCGAAELEHRFSLAKSTHWLQDEIASFHNIALREKQSVFQEHRSSSACSTGTDASSSSNGTLDDDIGAHHLFSSTPDDFRIYITALFRRGYPVSRGRTDVETVTQLLREAFHDTPSAAQVATTEEFNIALAFFHRYRKLPEARELFALMEESKCPLNVATFNIFIHNAANEQNLPAFHLWLSRMQQRDIAPDGSTWAALLEVAPSPDDKQEVTLEIYRKRLVRDRSSAALVLRKVISYSFDPLLEHGGEISTYLETLQRLFGYGLDDPHAVRQMLDALALRGRFNEALQLLHHLSVHDYKPSVSDLNILLLHCYKHLNGDTAVNVVGIFYQTWGVWPIATTMEHLFKLFWKARMYNATCVTWSYSCMWDYASFEMKSRLLRSLRRCFKGLANTVGQRWNASIGAVVLDATIAIESASQYLAHQAQQHASWSPTEPFPHILLRAMLQDQAWTRHGLKNSTSIQWKVENKIHVPVGRREAGDGTRDDKSMHQVLQYSKAQ